MSEAEKLKFSLTIMVNKEKTGVLFALAGGDFVDVLLSFLTLPLGKIVAVLKKHYGDQAPVIGSLTTLYGSFAKLNSAYFCTKMGKQELLHPKGQFEAKCKRRDLDISGDDEAQLTEYDTCCCYYRMSFISMYSDAAICEYCGRIINKETGENEGTMDFVISDDLRIFPSVTSLLQTFSILGVTDTDGAYLMDNVCFGLTEVMDLLQASLFSETPLSDIILGKKITTMNSRLRRPEPGTSYHRIEKEAASKFKEMTLKIVIQKSTGKLLFAIAEEDFIDFLSTFLTMCLGGVECLLDSNTSIKCIDNLCGSVPNIISNKNSIKTKLPYGYISNSELLPLSEECLSKFYQDMFWFSSSSFPSGRGNYIKKPVIYQVTDDLTVSPFCMALSIANLTRLGIHISDVKELELHIGLKKALNILKASLTSTCALTNGLMNQMKQEG